METNYPEKLIGWTVVPMFRRPDVDSEQVSQALLGARVRIVEERRGWHRIQTPDGYTGWVSSDTLFEVPAGWEAPWAEAVDLWVNFRSQPDYRRCACCRAMIGARLPLTKETGGWVQVLVPDGRRIWTEAHRMARLGEEPVHPPTPRAVCETARRFLGIPYLWGGTSPMGLDCSGFSQLVLRLHGVHLMRDAVQQSTQGDAVEEADAADLVFFGPLDEPERITHVAIMLDRTTFIHAAGSDRVRINRLADEPYAREFRFARRYVKREV